MKKSVIHTFETYNFKSHFSDLTWDICQNWPWPRPPNCAIKCYSYYKLNDSIANLLFQHNCLFIFCYRIESDTGPVNSPILYEESDTGANSSESEYLLSDPTGYKTHNVESSPDKKVQFNDGNGVPNEKERLHKEKKKKK